MGTPFLRARKRVSSVLYRMGRTKTLPADTMETPLKRCLTTIDITLLGIGHMVGAGIYVLTGTVAKDTAGPAITISFLLAGLVSMLSAVCYAEFGARVPKAGSAYVYTYVSVGEFWAFIIGWNIILEHMIGAASVARAWSGYVDSLFSNAISNTTVSVVGEMHEAFLATSPDPLAFLVTLIYCALLSVGVKGSTYFNSVFTLINMCVMTFVIIFGFWWADMSNWQSVPGGFAPFGFSGIIAGAATSFYAFVGFDSIATSGEEALNPAKSIPLATLISMSVVTVGYVLVGAALTLMVPYNTLNPSAAIPDAFSTNGVMWAKYVVSIGALCGMTTTLFGSLFSLPRCVYAMAQDGLLFSWLARVSDKTQVPVINMLLCGFMSAIIALLFDIEKLVEFMSIGTLLAYTIVSACVIILRYQTAERFGLQGSAVASSEADVPPTPATPDAFSQPEMDSAPQGGELRECFKGLLHWLPSNEGGKVVTWCVAFFTIASAGISSLLMWALGSTTSTGDIWVAILVLLLVIVAVICTMLICVHQQNSVPLQFKVPFVPFIPLLSIFCNLCLMVHLNPMTWIRFTLWMTIGLLVYFCYGLHHSKETEPVSSYSTLLSDSKAQKGTVFDAVREKISKVKMKFDYTESGGEKESILDQEEMEDEKSEHEEEDQLKCRK